MSPLRAWVLGFVPLAVAAILGAILEGAAILSSQWVAAALIAVLLAATVWVGIRRGDRLARAGGLP